MIQLPRCDRHRHVVTLPPLCHTCQRIAVEHAILARTIAALLSAGYLLNVNNGGRDDEMPIATNDVEEITGHMTATDDAFLNVYSQSKDSYIGWVRFVYGNDGYDVINDYTTNLETILAPINAYADMLDPDNNVG